MIQLPLLFLFFIFPALLQWDIADTGTAHIEWQPKTLQLIQKHGNYGRIIRLQSTNLLCCFEWQDQVWIKQSIDNGKSWKGKIKVTNYPYGSAANPELLQLLNGTIACFYNNRPTNSIHSFQISYCISRDRGKTWLREKVLYTADTKWKNGCWEPAAIQLTNGEVQVFFANENPYRSSTEQEITLLRADSGLKSWKKPERVSFRAGSRDGMPVPLILSDGKGIVVAIEDNGLNGNFKSVILYTTQKKNWRQPSIDGNSHNRWSALKKALDPPVYAGAPYIRQMPSGETILSIQTTAGNRIKPNMVVYIGDTKARNFTNGSAPFAVPGTVPCLWGSLFIKADHIVTAVGSTQINGVIGLWAVDGILRSVQQNKPINQKRNICR